MLPKNNGNIQIHAFFQVQNSFSIENLGVIAFSERKTPTASSFNRSRIIGVIYAENVLKTGFLVELSISDFIE